MKPNLRDKEFQMKPQRLIFRVPLLAAFLLFGESAHASVAQYLQPPQESPAFKQFQQRPKSELSKLLYLMDRFRNSEFKVVYNGTEYDSKFALKETKKYIAKNYKNTPAENWIKTHAYRAQGGGDLIYLKDPTGKAYLLRDVLLEELLRLTSIQA